jgi:hypothetical protein
MAVVHPEPHMVLWILNNKFKFKFKFKIKQKLNSSHSKIQFKRFFYTSWTLTNKCKNIIWAIWRKSIKLGLLTQWNCFWGWYPSKQCRYYHDDSECDHKRRESHVVYGVGCPHWLSWTQYWFCSRYRYPSSTQGFLKDDKHLESNTFFASGINILHT